MKRYIILLQNPTTTQTEKKLTPLGIKTTTRTTKTIKQIVKTKSKNTDPLSNAGVYKMRCQNFNKFYIEETSKRNLNKRIYEHKKDFKTGDTTNSLVSHNILTNHTFDFQNSAIFAFIESRSIAHHNTITPRLGFS